MSKPNHLRATEDCPHCGEKILIIIPKKTIKQMKTSLTMNTRDASKFLQQVNSQIDVRKLRK